MQRSITIPVMALFLVLILALPSVGAAVPSPLESMKGNVQKVMDVLKDPALKAADKRDERRKTLRGLADRIFDWVELSKRTLARSWNDLSVDQKREFVMLYADLLEKTYSDRIESYSGQEVAFTKETMLSDDKAEVKTLVKSTDKTIPIDYRLTLGKDGWLVYDVQVEGISLVQNYRKQFSEILASNPPDKMIEILRDKVKRGEVEAWAPDSAK
jgi:phospholipid transport system substrate-binding protein